MDNHLTCSQVVSLITFYVDGKLNPTLKKYVENHIKKCSSCRRKVEELQKIYFDCGLENRPEQKYIEEDEINDREIIKSLSAYIDHELNESDNIRVKKMTVSNPDTREKLELMYKFQKIMHSAYERTKGNFKNDYSKAVISLLSDSDDNYSTTYLKKLVILFFILLSIIISCFIWLNF